MTVMFVTAHGVRTYLVYVFEYVTHVATYSTTGQCDVAYGVYKDTVTHIAVPTFKKVLSAYDNIVAVTGFLCAIIPINIAHNA